MKLISTVFSYLFHPVFMLMYSLVLLLLVNPYLFSIEDPKAKVILIFSIAMLSVGFPLIGIAILKFLGLADDFNLDDRKARVIPLLISSIFYLWLFVNIKSNSYIPMLFSSIAFGATISIFLSFFINNFSKISLHTVGMGGLVAVVFLFKLSFDYQDFIISAGPLGMYKIHMNFVVLAVIIIAGIVGSSRKYITNHSWQDIYGGYLVGFMSQVLAYGILF